MFWERLAEQVREQTALPESLSSVPNQQVGQFTIA